MKDLKNILNPLIYSIGISLINDSGYSINNSDDKDNLILYLYLIILIANNDNYIKQDRGLYNCTEELKRVTFLRNESNYIVGQNNRKIIRSCFYIFYFIFYIYQMLYGVGFEYLSDVLGNYY